MPAGRTVLVAFRFEVARSANVQGLGLADHCVSEARTGACKHVLAVVEFAVAVERFPEVGDGETALRQSLVRASEMTVPYALAAHRGVVAWNAVAVEMLAGKFGVPASAVGNAPENLPFGAAGYSPLPALYLSQAGRRVGSGLEELVPRVGAGRLILAVGRAAAALCVDVGLCLPAGPPAL